MTPRTFLVLGRVSNLPTVWTNGLAGWALSGGAFGEAGLVVVLLALTLFYVGGMYLNDAFDADIDARERAARPIPRGEVSRALVAWLGTLMLALGVMLAFTQGMPAGIAGLGLAGAVVLYDWLHKRISWGPIIMGVARMLTYATAALAAGGMTTAVTIGALGLACHVVGLTYAAKQEAYDRIGAVWPLLVLAVPVAILAATLDGWLSIVLLIAYLGWGGWALRLLFRSGKGDVPRAVVSLIAAIALYDAVLVAASGMPGLALLAMAGFGVTLALQRVAPGT